MSPEEIREVWTRFLTGEELSPETQKSLVDALDADSELRESLLENLYLDGVLHAMSATRRHGETFVRNLSDCLGAEKDATSFVRKVESRLNENPPPPTTSPSTGRKSKKDTTRIFRRRSATSPGETAWRPALIAAAAFFAILLLVVSEFKSPPPRPIVKTPVPRTIPEQEKRQVVVTTPPEKRREELNIEEMRLRTAPLAPEEKPEDRERKLVANEEERRAIEAELAKRVPPPPTPRENKTVTAPAVVNAPTLVERLSGTVYLARNAGDKRRVKKDDAVPVGFDVETYPSSVARLRFSDNTWIELLPNSVFRETEAPSATSGRKVFLASGSLESQIAKQSPDRPMVFATPTGEATILGTTIRLTVSHDPKLGRTTLEVKEGKVLLTRLLDKKSVEVVTGQFAVAATGVDPVPQKCFPDEILVKFGPSDVQLQTGWVLDSGEPFDTARGYGWIGPKAGDPVPGLFWRDGQGKFWPKTKGRFPVRRQVPPGTDPLKATDVTAGWAGVTETWFMPIPNGKYLISVCCGDLTWEQGPHHVWVEGVQIIDQKKNRVGESIEVKDVPVEVKDGQLTMKVGGNPGSKVSSDGSTDSCINYLLIKRVRK